MMLEQKLKELILSKHKSIKEFSRVAQIPYTTLDSILKRGVENANVLNIIKLCQSLDIDTDALANGEIKPKNSNKEKPTTANSDELEKHLQDPFIRETLEKLEQLTPELRAAALAQLDILINVQESQKK